MKMQTIKVKLTFVEPLLGTASGNPNVQEEFIASKAENGNKTKEEVAAVTPADIDAQIEKASTIFPKDDTGLFLWDYQVKGFIKEAVGVQCELGNAGKLTKWTFKKVVDDTVFVTPRRIYLYQSDGTPFKAAPEICQRPLRATTMQGDRVALARSEMLPAGTRCEFTIDVLTSNNPKSRSMDMNMTLLEDVMNYGRLKGIGQWRNASYGRFEWKGE